jgi:hypothetical protein
LVLNGKYNRDYEDLGKLACSNFSTIEIPCAWIPASGQRNPDIFVTLKNTFKLDNVSI